MTEGAVDPRFAEDFMRKAWVMAQGEEHFRKRREFRQWWWDHVLVPGWKWVTWSHAAIVGVGIFVHFMWFIRFQLKWFGLAAYFQSLCLIGKTVLDTCPDFLVGFGHCPDRIAFPLTTKLVAAYETSPWLIDMVKAVDIAWTFHVYTISMGWYNMTHPWANNSWALATGFVCL